MGDGSDDLLTLQLVVHALAQPHHHVQGKGLPRVRGQEQHTEARDCTCDDTVPGTVLRTVELAQKAVQIVEAACEQPCEQA